MERTVRLVNRYGLHARPIGRVVEVARRYRATLGLVCGERSANGRSVLELMTLGAAQGATIVLQAEGDDAEALLEELEQLFADGFGDDLR